MILLSIQDRVRLLLLEQGSLPVGADTLTAETDLYAAGLTSLASVDLMLAIETTFDLLFPDEVLNRRTFATIASIAATVARLKAGA